MPRPPGPATMPLPRHVAAEPTPVLFSTEELGVLAVRNLGVPHAALQIEAEIHLLLRREGHEGADDDDRRDDDETESNIQAVH